MTQCSAHVYQAEVHKADSGIQGYVNTIEGRPGKLQLITISSLNGPNQPLKLDLCYT